MDTFKQKILYSAMAGIGHTSGGKGAANAVYANNDGLGEALVYPYYTMRKGSSALVSVVGMQKLQERKNTQEVLDFNLFLSPRDVWFASLALAGDTSRTKFLPDGSMEINGVDGLTYTLLSPLPPILSPREG